MASYRVGFPPICTDTTGLHDDALDFSIITLVAGRKAIEDQEIRKQNGKEACRELTATPLGLGIRNGIK